MSRKTIFAILGAVLLFVQKQFGLAFDSVAFLGVIIYLLGEAKVDLQRIGAQIGKFKDPKFWLAFVTTLLPVLNTELGLNLHIEAIVAILSSILALLFGTAYKKAKKARCPSKA